MPSISCHCPCESTRFELKREPVLRFYCHCTICQAFNEAPYADGVVMRKQDVVLPPDGQVVFKKWKAPPAVNRGRCSACDKAALETFDFPLMPSLCIIPSANVVMDQLPESSMHLFYHRRQVDVDDELPKYNGYVSSQAAFLLKLMTG